MRNPLAPFTTTLSSKLLRAIFLTLVATTSVFLFVIPGRTSDAPLVISEFRFRGPSGANDEFVEIYNNTDTNHTVTSSDGSSGYALAASDGTIRFVIPNGTIIPARGHYLGVNTIAYSLSNYPAGNGATATGDATFTTDIPDNAGVALFSSANAANLTLGNRFDAAGSTSVVNAVFREGLGFPAITPFNIDHSFVRRVPILGDNAGLPEDTDTNNADFVFVDTNGTSAGAGQRLGAPGPENLAGYRDAGSNINHSPIDPAQADNASPNVGRDFISDPANNATFGRLSIRRKFTNNTGVPLTALRLRIINLTTFPAPAGVADLRPSTSFAIAVPTTGGGVAVAEGTDLDQPPSQPNGGGFNSSMRAGLVNLISPLPAGASLNLNLVMGIQQTGCYSLAMVAEALPAGGGDVFLISGDTQGGAGCGAPTPTPTPTPLPTPGDSLIISEFRLRGVNGANDEFVELYNNSDITFSVLANDGSSGYALAASDGIARFVIPNGTIIPARGHFLGVNSSGYSLGGYPAGNGTTATGDLSFTLNIPDNAGIALFRTSNAASFTLANRLDAVGSTSEANAIYKEGAGYPPIVAFNIDCSFHRKIEPVDDFSGFPTDLNNNAFDFQFVDANGTSAGAGQRLGAPGPENLSGPRSVGFNINNAALDSAQAETDSPNVSRSFVSDPANNSTFGTLSVRRTFTNNSGADITRLRFRVVDLTTFPSPSGVSDLRPRTSGPVVVSLTGGGNATVAGTTLEQPPSQVNGGGFNSSMSVSSVTTATPLLDGASINVQFLMGIQQTGCYRFAVLAESLPGQGSLVFVIAGDTQGGVGACAIPTPTPTPTPSPEPSPSPTAPPPTPSPTPTPTPTPAPGGTSLIISEYRLRGPNGANDEFVEIYNNSDVGVNVLASDGSSGFAVAASDGIARFVIPNGTIIPARGHFLGVNSVAYSIGGYPAGNSTTATGNASFTLNIADNAGIGVFRTSNAANFTVANRLDAVGPTTEANATYREGAGLASIVPFSIDYSWYRNIPSTGAGAGLSQDTNNNAADFKFVDTNGTSAGGGQRLGAPGPEDLSSPGHLSTGPSIGIGLIDPGVAANASPNFVRDFTSDPANNSTFGTISVRRRFTNATGVSITRFRFRIIGLTTFPAPSGTADLRPRTSGGVVAPVSGGGTAIVSGTTLEQPPSQPNGGGFNSSMSANTVNLPTPLNNGGSIDLQLLFGVQQTGDFNFCAVIETLPFTNSAVMCVGDDAVPPILISSLALTSLSPANSDLVNVGLAASANEPATFGVQVFGDENDETATAPNVVHSPDAKDIAVGTLRLRAERTNAGDGRVYLVVVTATDTAGNASRACHTVVVARNKKADVDAQAAAAKSFCEANAGAAPPGYFVIGDGPIIGPKQ